MKSKGTKSCTASHSFFNNHLRKDRFVGVTFNEKELEDNICTLKENKKNLMPSTALIIGTERHLFCNAF